MTGWIGAIAAGGILAVLAAIGAAVYWFYNSAYSAGKKAAKLNQAEKELADAKRAADILAEQRTAGDTAKRLDDGTL